MPIQIDKGSYLDLVEGARLVGVHPESLRRLVRYGEVKALKLERGLYFTKESLGEAFDLHDVNTKSPKATV